MACAPHIGLSAAVCAPATTNFLASALRPPLRERLALTPAGGPELLANGQIPVPGGPGLGIDIDPDVLAHYTLH